MVFMELQMLFDEGSNRKVTVIVTVQFFVAHFFAFSGLQEGFFVQLDFIKSISGPLRNMDGGAVGLYAIKLVASHAVQSFSSGPK